MPRPDPKSHGKLRAALNEEAANADLAARYGPNKMFPMFPSGVPDKISYAVMPMGPDDVRALAKATGYSVSALKAVLKVYESGGFKAAGGAALAEALKVAGAGVKGAAEKAQKLKTMLSEVHAAARKIVPEAAQERWAVEPVAKVTEVEPSAPVSPKAQQKAVAKLSAEEIEKLRAANRVAKDPLLEAGLVKKDAVIEPSSEALRKRVARADAKMDPEAQEKLKTLKEIAEPEVSMRRSRRDPEALIQRRNPQHMPEPFDERVVEKAANDPVALQRLKYESDPEVVKMKGDGKKVSGKPNLAAQDAKKNPGAPPIR